MTDLRSKIIRLAHAHPELRADLLPLVAKKATEEEVVLKWASATLSDREAARFTSVLPRGSYIPKDNPTLLKLHTPPGLEIYRWEDTFPNKVVLSAIAFAGKADKPLWYRSYRPESESKLQEDIKATIASFTASMAAKKQKQDARKNFVHPLKVGDILYASWGYDQTNIDWYQVTDVVGKSVVIREIAGKLIGESGPSDKVIPSPNNFIGPPMKKIPQGSAGSDRVWVKITSSALASLWDGKPKYQTGAGFGH